MLWWVFLSRRNKPPLHSRLNSLANRKGERMSLITRLTMFVTAMFIGLPVLTYAQPSGVNYTSSTTGWLKLGNADAAASECKQLSRDVTFEVPDSKELDPNIKFG